MRVVVVGAGVLGLGTALALAGMDGVETTVLEARHPGGGSTGLSAGCYVRQYMEREELEVRCEGVRRLVELEKDHGLNLRRIGFMRIIRDEATLRNCELSAEMQREFGVADARVITPAEALEVVPHLNTEGVIAALWGPSDGYLDGTELCTTLAEMVKVRGVTIKVRTEVKGLSRAVAGGSKYTVHTDMGDFPADAVVNAAGAWLGKVGDRLGAPVEMLAERHEALIFKLPPEVDYTFPTVADYVPSSEAAEGVYFRHEGADQLVAGMHSNELSGAELVDPDNYKGTVTEEGAEHVMAALAASLNLDDIGHQGGWAGLYPHSAAGRAIVGPHPANSDIIVAGGLAGQGITPSTILGEGAAEWAAYGELRRRTALQRLTLPAPANDGATA